MAEERRLFYVGITRTKDRLYLTHTFRRATYGNTEPKLPSRFLGDLPVDLVEGLNPRVSLEAEIRNMRDQTHWAAEPVPSSEPESPAREYLRTKIVPFPGHRKTEPTRFKPNDRVIHKDFGTGVVLESKVQGGVEQVTVAFKGATNSIKKLDAEKLELVEQ